MHKKLKGVCTVGDYISRRFILTKYKKFSKLCFLFFGQVTINSKWLCFFSIFKNATVLAESFKGIVSWDWDWLEWIVNGRSRELRIAGAYFYAFWCHFHVIICKKKQALSVSHLTVTLRMMSNNHRLVSSIGFVHVRSIL